MSTALSIKNLTKIYPNGFEALQGINLDIQQGDFFALLGANGAGKSTTINVITQLLPLSSGSVQIFGKDIYKHSLETKLSIGLVPQEFNFNIFENVEDILLNQAGYYGIPRSTAKKRVEKHLRALGLWEKRRHMARTLSGGMKRRLMIARGLIHDPALLILDEPSAGVDVELRRLMWDFLEEMNAEGKTIILTTHYLEEAEKLCRNAAIINHGKILLQDSVENLLRTMQRETFVLSLKEAIKEGVAIKTEDFCVKQKDGLTLELTKTAAVSMNEILQRLSNDGIIVASMTNKANRLEELFVDLIANDRKK